MTALLFVALVGIFLSVGCTVIVFGLAATERRQVGRSLAAIRHGSEVQRVVGDSVSSRFLAPVTARLTAFADHLSPDGTAEAIARRLDQAGNPGGLDVQRVFAIKGASLALLAAGGASLGSSRGVVLLLLYTVVGGAIGVFLPDLLIYNMGLRRQDAIRRDCADALDLLVIGVEAGLGFDASLSQVAQKTKGPLAAEFVRVLQEMRIGQSRTQAFRDLAARCTVPEIHSLVGALVQADKLGVPIAHILREQAKEMRLRRRQRAEEQAMKIPVKILFPMVICILPAMFVVVLGPGAISIAHTLSN